MSENAVGQQVRYGRVIDWTVPPAGRGPEYAAPTPPLIRRYPRASRRLQQVLGPQEVRRLAKLTRNEIISQLRVKHRWSLAAIADLFDLSRERIRQLTPPIEGPGRTPSFESEGQARRDRARVRRALRRVFRRAVRTPEAWNPVGRLSKRWVVEQLGYEPQLPELDFRSLDGSKVAFILRYGLGMESEGEMRAWARRMYVEHRMTFDQIAGWLSRRFVPISTMAVHRVITRDFGIESLGRGKRDD
jgi:hypothetical protein